MFIVDVKQQHNNNNSGSSQGPIEGHEFELLILCPPHRTHVLIMLAQGQGQSLHLGFHLEPGRIFNITLVTYCP